MNRQQMRASRANGRRLIKRGWDAWEDVTREIQEMRQRAGKSPDAPERAHKNSMFVVQIYREPCSWGDVKLCMIRRNDESAAVSWSDRQRIKNELFGVEAVAVEVFPAESELVDDANMFHLWILPEGFELPFRLT